jgi:hypothetical protein
MLRWSSELCPYLYLIWRAFGFALISQLRALRSHHILWIRGNQGKWQLLDQFPSSYAMVLLQSSERLPIGLCMQPSLSSDKHMFILMTPRLFYPVEDVASWLYETLLKPIGTIQTVSHWTILIVNPLQIGLLTVLPRDESKGRPQLWMVNKYLLARVKHELSRPTIFRPAAHHSLAKLCIWNLLLCPPRHACHGFSCGSRLWLPYYELVSQTCKTISHPPKTKAGLQSWWTVWYSASKINSRAANA